MYAIHDSDGRLISIGTVIADPLPEGLTAVELSDEDAQRLTAGEYRWNPDTRAPEPNPVWEQEQVYAANEAETGTKLVTVDLPAMQAIIAQTNADLRADPSQEIKDIARAVRRLCRQVENIHDGVD